MSDTAPVTGNDFVAAKAVFDACKDLPKPAQERVLRWVAESLGVAVPPFLRQATGADSPFPRQPERAAVEPPEPTAPASPAAPDTPVDIATFIRWKNPQSDVQFVTAVAFYYRFVSPQTERRDTVDGDFVQDATRTGGWDRLTSPLTTLNNAKKKGYLDSAARGEFRINTVGENLVDRTLPLDDGSAEGRRPSTRKSSAKKAAKGSAAKRTAKVGRKTKSSSNRSK